VASDRSGPEEDLIKNDVKNRLKGYIPHVIKAREENHSEANTVILLVKIFEDVLGYDALSEITRECQVKNKYVDIAIKVENGIRFLVEAKSAGNQLRDRYVEKAQHYAAEAGVPWVLLTNAVDWYLYHLSFDEGEGIGYVKAFAVDLSSDPIDVAADRLSVLHRQSVAKGGLEDYWRKRSALSAQSIAQALFTHETLGLVRRQIHHKDGLLIDEEDLAHAIDEMFSSEARELIGPVKIRHKTRKKPDGAKKTDAPMRGAPAPQAAPEANGEPSPGGQS
jgi:predicted type IV restriction endonuclease